MTDLAALYIKSRVDLLEGKIEALKEQILLYEEEKEGLQGELWEHENEEQEREWKRDNC